MARMLSLVLPLLVVAELFCPASFAPVASLQECNYYSGHGFVLFSDSKCQTHWIHHLGEFECPHQYDVKARVSFLNSDDEAQYCKDAVATGETTYCVAPEFILPNFIVGNIANFTSPLYRGFFTDDDSNVINEKLSLKVEEVFYARQYDTLPITHLTYLIWPASPSTLPADGSAAEFFVSHYITVPPNFDQIMRVRVLDSSFWSPERVYPLTMYMAETTDEYVSRFSVDQLVTGMLFGGNSTDIGKLYTFHVLENVYPSVSEYNGDGQTDFLQYCVEPARPRWYLCA